MIPQIRFKKLHKEAKLPIQALGAAIGADLFAFVLSESGRPSKAIIPPRNTRAISTGLLIEPPAAHQAKSIAGNPEVVWTPMVFSRSGLALRSIWVANAPGLIDPDYRGELKVILYNGGLETQYIEHDQRIAQIVLVHTTWPRVIEVEALSESERGDKGLGSTGK